MKPGHLVKDYKFLEQQTGTSTHGKNGVRNANTNAVQNEKGFRVSSASIPYDINGIIETDTDPVIFSTNDVYSAFGFYNEATDTYTPIINDQLLAYKLGFRRELYIKGEARRNYKNHIEIAWLDKLNPVRFADTEDPPTDLSGYLIFPEFSSPDITLDIINGGTLGMGSYYVAVKYLNPDGTETRYTTPFGPSFGTAPNFAAIPGGSTGKLLQITIDNIDSRYKSIQVAVIKRLRGVTTVVELPAQTAVGSATITYTGSEGEDITLEEVLIPSAFYDNAGSITQLNDVLYLADMQEANINNLQKYASLIRIRVKSNYRSTIENDEDVKSGKLRTFKHGEAYAFYGVYKLVNGQYTDAFTIPGPASTGNNNDISAVAAAEGFVARNYQVDTVGLTGINTTDKTCSTGVWLNQSETYPSDDSFNSAAVGGIDLRGHPVRHHKMPTISQMKNSFYSTDSTYGVTGLDVLGITAENIIIPPELQGIVVGVEIYYARRDYASATIMSQGLVIHGAKSGYTGQDIYFTGGNFSAHLLRSDQSHTDTNRKFNLVSSIFKISHADLMVNRPAITPTFLASNYKIQATIGDAQKTLADEDELNFIADYVKQGSVLNSAYTIKGVQDTGYLPNNASRGLIKNIKSEDGFTGTYNNTGFAITATEAVHNGHQTIGDPEVPVYEQSHLVDISVVKSDLYNSFQTQDLVRTGVLHGLDATAARVYAYAGDCFLVIHSYWGYGVTDSPDRYPTNPGRVDNIDGREEDTYIDEFYKGTSGIKVARRYVAESIMNLWQRYVDPALPESEFWPAVAADTMNGMDRNKDNNIIAISPDASSIGDLLNGIKTYDFDQVNIQESPYKIIRSNKQAKEGKLNSWKNFNALDYFEADKNMGRIINLQGYDDRLIIHHRNAIYLTQDKTTLQGDILSVTLGSGDIFRLQPKQGKPSKTGYAGTQHQLACMLTDYGYVFPDAEAGILYVLNGEGLQEINIDLYNFLHEYLNIPEINPFVGNGICIGYDAVLKRILLTVKNLALLDDTNYVPNYQETTEFFATLIPGKSIVFKDGRYQLYMGANTSIYSCTSYPSPVLGNYTFTIPENSVPSTVVGTVAATSGTGAISYMIMSGNTEGAFTIDPVTGKIVVTNQNALNFAETPVFTLVIKATDTRNNSDTGTVTVNLTEVPQAPVTQDYTFEVDENSPVNTVIGTIAATDPKSLPLTFSIESQDVAGAVQVHATTGVLSVLDPTDFDFTVNPLMNVVVRVENTDAEHALSEVLIILQNVNEVPVVTNSTLYISEDDSGIIGYYVEPTDPDEADVITVEVISQSVPGAFSVDTDTRAISVHPTHELNPTNNPYTITLRATDNAETPLYSDFIVTIWVSNESESDSGSGGVGPDEVGNEEASANYLRNNCSAGFTGSAVRYTVPANTYFGDTQEEADDARDADILLYGQIRANGGVGGLGITDPEDGGACILNTTYGIVVVDVKTDTTLDICMYIDTVGVAESNNIVAKDGQNFYLTDSVNNPATAYMLSSDEMDPATHSTIVHRFEINIGKLMAQYPAITHFFFQLRGRSQTAGIFNYRYVNKDVTQGNMTMTGTAGSYIPSVDNPSNNGIIDTSSNVVAGANGAVGVAIGSLIVTFDYNVSTNLLTVTNY